MTSINTNYKANTVDPATQSTDPYVAQMQAEIQAALEEIEQFKLENAEWLSEEQLVQMDRIFVTLKAQAAAIEAGGVLGGPGMSGAVDEEGNLLNQPQELQPEFNGIPDDCIDSGDAYGQGLIADDPARYGDFGGTVSIPNSGDVTSPTKVAFQMTDDMVAIYGESRGRDIIITVEYEDGSRKSWVIKEGTVRPEPIVISALGLSHGVKMDFSHVMRVSTGEYPGYPYGSRSGFYIHGTEYDDEIIATQSDDAIVAYAGNDTIDGMAGNDSIWGDEYYQMSGQFDMGYGGNDTIKGGTGDDIIYGGGGLDTSFKSDKKESVSETEGWENDIAEDMPPPGSWFGSPSGDWEVQPDMEDGMAIIENTTGNAGVLEIDMPNGYDMAYAEKDADGNLIITFVGDEGTFKVKIEDFFNEQWNDDGVVKLIFNGSSENEIIDFSRVPVTSQAIKILGGNGDDIILGAESALLADGVDIENMLESQKNSDNELQGYVDEGIFAVPESEYEDDMTTANGYQADVQDGQIVITDDGDPNTDPADKLNIKAPDGYDHGYITTDAAGNIYVILVKQTESGKAETIVIKIDKDLCGPGGLTYSDISIKHAIVDDDEETFGSPLALIPVSCDYDDYLIDGGAGNDLAFFQKGANVKDVEDEVEIEPEPYIEPTLPTSSEPVEETSEAESEESEEAEEEEEN